MAYIPGYTYDIFISYAHLDNQTISGENGGWIEDFYKHLNLKLAQHVGELDGVKIWWDNKKLDGSTLFGPSIEEGIEQSALMICLVSPGYLQSDYCKKELDLFYRKARKETAGLQIGKRSRILNVLLNNYDYRQWPKELSGAEGFPFYTATENDDLGDPLEIGTDAFKNQLKALRDSVFKLIVDFKKQNLVTPAKSTENVREENDFVIYMGDVTDSLRTIRKRTITELEKKGYKIVGAVPPPYEAKEHELKVNEELKRAALTVHLLDQNPGREIAGNEDISYPQKQAELGLQATTSQIIWIPKDLDIAAVEEEQYKLFLQNVENGTKSNGQYEFIRGTQSTLAGEIADFAEQLKQRLKPKKDHDKLAVLLDTHLNDQLCALDLGKNLLEHNIQPYINPQDDDPRKNINQLADRISMVSKLIFFYGMVSKEWVVERMNAALQLILTNNYEIEDFFIFLAPPAKNAADISLKQKLLRINVINNSQEQCISSASLDQLLKNLKSSQA